MSKTIAFMFSLPNLASIAREAAKSRHTTVVEREFNPTMAARLYLALILALTAAGVALACESAPAPAPLPAPLPTTEQSPSSSKGGSVPYRVPLRTPAELERDLARTCVEARESHKLVLLELSAPWCKDCVRLQSMKQDPRVVQALTGYRELSVNVGDFDQHPSLLQAFGVRAIAHWELLEPTDCAAPPWRWRRLGHRTLEPETGKRRVTPEDLASWLEARTHT